MKKEVTLKEMKTIQLSILQDIHKFCIDNQIRYSIYGGTLLGAIRHGGYIPWDDDIDLLMPRPDYEKFISIYKSSNPHYVLQNYKNDDSCCFPFTKVYDNRTVLIEYGIKNGVYVDIFPIDGEPCKEKLQTYIKSFMKMSKKLAQTTKFYKFRGGIWMKIKYFIKRLIYPSRKKIIRNLDVFFAQHPFDSSEYAGGLVASYPLKEHMRRDVYSHYKEMKFEGLTVMGLENYDTYLHTTFGNYMQFPPKEQQVTHHNYIVYWKK